ncbi:MAG: hypothetical protein J7513_16000 [Solirubrobacteraceae bacterium]|nr:hypothetical protein [Solirubrobacteraceae bacterium]
MSKLLTLALASILLLISAATASAGTSVSLQTGGGNGAARSVQANVGVSSGNALDVTITGGANGVLTFSDPGGVTFSAVPSAPACTTNSATSVTCGVPNDPITYVIVSGGSGDDQIDLSGLAAQASGAGTAFSGPSGTDFDSRTGWISLAASTYGGADTIVGGGITASYDLGDGDDTVSGGPGNEIVRPGANAVADGDDTFAGGGGYDTMTYSRRTSGVSATIGDTQTSGNGSPGEDDRLSGIEGLTGGTGNDTLTITGAVGGLGTLLGQGGDDTLTGGPSTDRLEGGPGADELDGGGGDDYLTDDRRFGEAQGHLDGGPGDDELVQTPPFGPTYVAAPDGVPTCGSGTDVLRADYQYDDGVGEFAGPADCELLANSGSAPALLGKYRVGSSVYLGPSSIKGSPTTGRGMTVTWLFCSPSSQSCSEKQVTTQGSITFGPGDVGKTLLSAWVDYDEPLSQAPRWIEERTALNRPGSRISSLGGGGTIYPADYPDCSGQYPTYPGYPDYYPACPAPTPSATPTATPTPAPEGTPIPTATPAASPAPTAPKPTAAPKPGAASAAVLTQLIKKALGKTPKIAFLTGKKVVTVSAPTGARVTVRVTTQGKKPVLISRAAAIAVGGKASLKLRPTRAGKKLAKGKKPIKVRIVTVAQNAAGTATSTVKTTLR